MCDEAARLKALAVPLLYVLARQDRLVRRSSLEAIRLANPDTVVAEIDGPHFILQREPQAAADAITRFIEASI
jgi:pimeloyl-ACP methyl ester carboxylesterase